MTPRADRRALVLVAALALAGRTARAQQVDDASFEGAFAAGLQALDGRRFADALAAFTVARRTHDVPRVRYNLALAARGAGRYLVAIEAFEAYLAAPDATDTSERLARVTGAVAEMRALLARVRFVVSPPGATLTLDGVLHAHPDAPLPLDPGEHALSARADGYVPVERSFTLRAGADDAIEVRLEERPADARVVITPSLATASVSLDGVDLGHGPVERRVDPGEHVVVLSAPDHLPLRRVFTAGRAGVVRLDATLSRRPTPSRAWIPAVVIGGAALVAGAVTLTAWLTRGEEPYVTPSWGNFRE